MTPRPLSITLLALLWIGSGAVGLAYHLSELNLHQPLHNDILWVSLVRVLAIVAGIFLLRGRNWARWLAIAWTALHVVISLWHSWSQAAVHVVVFAVFSFFLFRAAANEYFRSDRASK